MGRSPSISIREVKRLTQTFMLRETKGVRFNPLESPAFEEWLERTAGQGARELMAADTKTLRAAYESLASDRSRVR